MDSSLAVSMAQSEKWPAIQVTATDEPVILTCHCKRIQVTVPAMPRRVNECQCSVCYRYGVLWAYYLRRQVMVESLDPSVYPQPYSRADAIGNGDLAFVHCSHCGCVTHWEGTADTPKRKGPEARMGVNWRMAPQSTLQGIERVVTCKLKDSEMGVGTAAAVGAAASASASDS